MRNYKMLLQYEGSRYNGWQKQGNTQNTIQGRLEAALFRLTGEPAEIQGSGRTDAGVHALGQVANFRLPETWSLSREGIAASGLGNLDDLDQVTALRMLLNHFLPEDIGVDSIQEAPERFHSRLWAVGKTYQYRIGTDDHKNIKERQFIYPLGRKLDCGAMRRAAADFLGTHDFASFCGNPRMKKSTVRRVTSLEIEELSHETRITVSGNGFLQNMVRILAGTLIEIGLGKRAPEDMKKILEGKNRALAGPTAPAKGLCLMRVEYDRGKL